MSHQYLTVSGKCC